MYNAMGEICVDTCSSVCDGFDERDVRLMNQWHFITSAWSWTAATMDSWRTIGQTSKRPENNRE